MNLAEKVKEFNLLIAGVGGQGGLLASQIVAMAAIKAGINVRIGETHGLSQRGGPVMSHVRMGSSVYGSLMGPGDCDVLIGFEPAEAARRAAEYLKDGCLAVINTRKLYPTEVVAGITEYPDVETLLGIVKKITDNVVTFDATKVAEEAGDVITMNVVMLGALAASGKLPFPGELLRESVKERIPERALDVNLKAFELGMKKLKGLSK